MSEATETAAEILRTLDAIARQVKAESSLRNEPALARVKADKYEQDQTIPTVYYICRGTVPSPSLDLAGAKFSGYHAPIGQLAAQDPGVDLDIAFAGKVHGFLVRENARFSPQEVKAGWDAFDAHLKWQGGDHRVQSLRALLFPPAPIAPVEPTGAPEPGAPAYSNEFQSALDAALAEVGAQHHEVASEQVRVIRDSMSLRDQPILDMYQDRVFRLPLEACLVLLGPPGTGKSTTLIHRLSQKLQWEYLEDDERRRLDQMGLGQADLRTSWLMVAPSRLLLSYLSEAMGREGVPTDGRRLQTWDTVRQSLAGQTLPILRGNGGLVGVDASGAPRQSSGEVRSGYDALSDQLWSMLREPLMQESDRLRSQLDSGWMTEDEFERVIAPLLHVEPASGVPPTLTQLVEMEANAARALRETVADEFRGVHFRWPFLVSDVGQSLARMAPAGDDEELDADAPPAEESDDLKARRAIEAAIRRRALVASGFDAAPTRGKIHHVLQNYGDRLPTADHLRKLGSLLGCWRAIGRYVRQFLELPRTATKVAQERRKSMGKDTNRLSYPELEEVILLSLNWARLFAASRSDTLNRLAWVQAARAAQRLQIMVDEVTDFSPVQLAILVHLTKPAMRSFFCCGDFNQRVTATGLRDVGDLEWAVRGVMPRLTEERIQYAYRQGAGLLALTAELASGAQVSELPASAASTAQPPILLENATWEDVGPWLVERVREVREFAGKLPSIGIFVDGVDAVKGFVEACSPHFDDVGLLLRGYPDGQAVGFEEEVRVFDIKHVKGLEFEATFIIGLDHMIERHGELAEKLLFVGATRAATFLGLTCEQTLPEQLARLRPHLRDGQAGWRR